MIDIGVMTCAARWGSAEKLRQSIGGDVTIRYDSGGGCWPTARRVWEALVELPGTHALVLQDDVGVCRDFRATLDRCVHARPESPLGFYAPRKAVDEARARGDAWVPIPDGVWGPSLLLPKPWVPEMLAWLDDPESYSSKHKRLIRDFPASSWYDRRVEAFLRHSERLPVWHTVPSLVEHLAASRSLLGHNNASRVARWFIGEDVSGLTVDWAA